MKSVFSKCPIFSFCFLIMVIGSSCTSDLIVSGGRHVPKDVTIYVTAYDTSGRLTLQDVSQQSADPFTAYPGQKIRWKISGISHFVIDNIVEKSATAAPDMVFKNKPHPVRFFSRSWRGTLKDTMGLHPIAFVNDSSGKWIPYTYKIVWHKAGQHTFDPTIRIKL